MAGTIIVSSIKTDTDNSFIVRSNTGATLFSVDTTSISIPDGSITSAMIANGTVIAADVADGSITTSKIADGNVTNAKIDSVANTKITGLITSGQIASVANTQITGNITQSQIATGVAGTGPAFSAYQSTSQTGIANSTWTKQIYDTEEYDTNSNFASSRFTPTVAGYYLFTASVLSDTLMSGRLFCALYKNGTVFKQGAGVQSSSARLASILSAVAYANGSTDYFELYAFSDAGVTWITNGGFSPNYFQASMIRSA